MKHNHKLGKRIAAVLLMVGIVVSCMVMAFAFDLKDLVPHGSNPIDTGETTTVTTPVEETSTAQSWNPIDLFTPTAPDSVKEAFGIADDNYAKTHDYCFAVNTSQNIVIAYGKADDGTYTKPVKAFICSCGKDSSPTKKGTFKTTDTYRWRLLNGGVYGQWATRITGSYLFHSVPYTAKDPSTLETEEYNKLGSNASAGCVRLSVKDAKWIQKHCPEGTIVTIYDGSDVREPLSRPTAVKIDVNSPYAGWDPTDPNENNPWNK